MCMYLYLYLRHIRYLLSTELAQTLTCSLILSGIDYCNAVLHGTWTGTIQKLQQVQNNAARIVLQASRRSHAKSLLHQLHWLPIQQRITYNGNSDVQSSEHVHSGKVSFLLQESSSDRITERVCSRPLRSSVIPLLVQPFTRTDFSRRAFSFSALSVWNSLLQTVLISDSLY